MCSSASTVRLRCARPLGVIASVAAWLSTACERLHGPEGFAVAEAYVVTCTSDAGADLITAAVESAPPRGSCYPDDPAPVEPLSCEALRSVFGRADRPLCDVSGGRVTLGGHVGLWGWNALTAPDSQILEQVIMSTCTDQVFEWAEVEGSITASHLDPVRERAQVKVEVEGARGRVNALYCDARNPI